MRGKKESKAQHEEAGAVVDFCPSLAGIRDEESGSGICCMRATMEIDRTREWAESTLRQRGLTWHMVSEPRSRHFDGLRLPPNVWMHFNGSRADRQERPYEPGSEHDLVHAKTALLHCERLAEVRQRLSEIIGQEAAEELVGVVAQEAASLEVSLISAGQAGWLSRDYRRGKSRNRSKKNAANSMLAIATYVHSMQVHSEGLRSALECYAADNDLAYDTIRKRYNEARQAQQRGNLGAPRLSLPAFPAGRPRKSDEG
jgi:hypothetical protein